MNKTDSIVESIVRKIEKTAEELSSYTGKKSELTVGGGKFQVSWGFWTNATLNTLRNKVA